MDERTREQIRQVRRVWAAVTRDPQATLEELGVGVGYTKSMVRLILRKLRAMGHIDYQDRSKGARTILVPFVEVRKTDTAI